MCLQCQRVQKGERNSILLLTSFGFSMLRSFNPNIISAIYGTLSSILLTSPVAKFNNCYSYSD
jgi:preprotein translocase subunit SecF